MTHIHPLALVVNSDWHVGGEQQSSVKFKTIEKILNFNIQIT